MKFVSHRTHLYGPPRPVTEIALRFLYVDDVRTSQNTLVDLTVCYGDSLFYM
jgi:hypothetical protein